MEPNWLMYSKLGNGKLPVSGSLAVTRPQWSAERLAQELDRPRVLGVKPYYSLIGHDPTSRDKYLEVSIFDFLPHHQLEVLNERRAWVTLHVPKADRLGHPRNIAEIREIRRRYPRVILVIAHLGRFTSEAAGVFVGDNADNPRFIETVPRRGYKFIAPVEWVGMQMVRPAPATEPLPHSAVEQVKTDSGSSHRLVMGLVAFIVIVALLLITTGLAGLLIAIPATAIGLIPSFFGTRRTNCLGVLLVPIILNMAGVGPDIARWLGLG